VDGIVERITAVSRRPASLGSVPRDAVSLAMGEPWQGTPPAIVDSAVEALRGGRTRYSPLTGSPTLKAAIAAHLEGRHGRRFAEDQVVCTHGASGGLAATVLAVVGPGDRVLIPEPTYSLYADQVALAGGEVEWVANRPDGSVDVDAVVAALPGTRLLVLCSPCNPTGNVVSAPDLAELSRAAASVGALLLCDEAYCDIVFDGRSFCSALDLPEIDHVICVRTFSKSYAMTGWRLGYVVAPPGLASGVNLVHRTFAGALGTFVQDAGVAALATPADELAESCAEYQRRRDLVIERLAALPRVTTAPPQGAFYAFVRVDTALSADELAARCADGGVLVRSGTEYGPSGEHAIRLSFAVGLEELEVGLARLGKVLG